VEVKVPENLQRTYSDNIWMAEYEELRTLGKPKAYFVILACYHDTPIAYLAGNEKELREKAARMAGFVNSEGNLSRDGFNMVNKTEPNVERAIFRFRSLFPESDAHMLLTAIQQNIFSILREEPEPDKRLDYLTKATAAVKSGIIVNIVEQKKKLERLSKNLDETKEETKPQKASDEEDEDLFD